MARKSVRVLASEIDKLTHADVGELLLAVRPRTRARLAQALDGHGGPDPAEVKAPPPELKVTEVAKLLNVNRSTVLRWIWSGQLPAVRHGHGWRVTWTEMEARHPGLWERYIRAVRMGLRSV